MKIRIVIVALAAVSLYARLARTESEELNVTLFWAQGEPRDVKPARIGDETKAHPNPQLEYKWIADAKGGPVEVTAREGQIIKLWLLNASNLPVDFTLVDMQNGHLVRTTVGGLKSTWGTFGTPLYGRPGILDEYDEEFIGCQGQKQGLDLSKTAMSHICIKTPPPIRDSGGCVERKWKIQGLGSTITSYNQDNNLVIKPVCGS